MKVGIYIVTERINVHIPSIDPERIRILIFLLCEYLNSKKRKRQKTG
ncbi:unnamed protein product [marine sediment metagenome]|uniref:Uncharacterized protein n=1 Tax=marine sediment metagenome TaxID=412755 RepID=X0RZP9_9ZZZZ